MNKVRLGKILFPILLCLSGLFLVGCAVQPPSKGWSGPTVSEGTLYVGSIEGRILALDSSTGDFKWDFPLEKSKTTAGSLACAGPVSRPMSIYSTPVVSDGRIYVGDYGGNVYAIDIASEGRKRAEFKVGDGTVGSPVIALDTVFIGSSDGKLYAFYSDLTGIKWTFETGNKIWATPAIDVERGIVYFGSFDKKVYALHTATGEKRWEFETQAGVLSTPLVYSDTIYIGSCDFNFYAINAFTGKEKWVFEASNFFWTKALAYNGEIWVGSLDKKVYALDAISGEKKWEFETGGAIRTPPVLVDGSVILGSEDGNIYIFDPLEKRLMRKISLEAPILAPLYSDPEKGVIYAHAQNGNHRLYALEVRTGMRQWNYLTSE